MTIPASPDGQGASQGGEGGLGQPELLHMRISSWRRSTALPSRTMRPLVYCVCSTTTRVFVGIVMLCTLFGKTLPGQLLASRHTPVLPPTHDTDWPAAADTRRDNGATLIREKG